MASADAVVAALRARPCQPFALLYRPERHSGVEVICGDVAEFGLLDDLKPVVEQADTLILVPFRQIGERGYACNDDGEPILALSFTSRDIVDRSTILAAIAPATIGFDAFAFDVSDEDYQKVVRAVVADEIGAGAGSNFVIARSLIGSFGPDPLAAALGLFRKLLTIERGSYWTFVVHTGTRTFVGASPEAHLVLDDGVVQMNPISGTYRYSRSGPSLSGMLDFIADQKEVDELFMVVDEELKIMARIADAGGTATGPFLKEMAHLAHTEYVLRGRSTGAATDLLRRTMFAPTVMGSPLVNASRVIARYEQRGRGYYGGVIALVDRGESGAERMDSAILIRTAVVDATGVARITVGSTLVRDSDPVAETAETRAKAAGLTAAVSTTSAPCLAHEPAVLAALRSRNEWAAEFWLTAAEQRGGAGSGAGIDAQVLLIDAEDNFTAMLSTMLHALGLHVTIASTETVVLLDDYDLVVFGPGPGDPRDLREPRVRAIFDRMVTALGRRLPFLAVCLSHQVLCGILGLPVDRLTRPNQGAGREIRLFDRTARLGFYNTFVGRSSVDAFGTAAGRVSVARDPVTREVFALRGARFESFQFHAESVLSRDGAAVLSDTVRRLIGLGDSSAARPPLRNAR